MEINPKPLLTQALVQSGFFRDHHMVLVDVGAGGGIKKYWNIYGDQLTAYGFEPIIEECQKLNANTPFSTIKYFDYFVESDDPSDYVPKDFLRDKKQARGLDFRSRASYHRYQKEQTYESRRNRLTLDDQGTTVNETKRITIDQFFSDSSRKAPDFIKVDSDGSDLQILLKSIETLKKAPVLGILVEASFFGVCHPKSNNVVNIHQLMHEMGFSIFDMNIVRYSRKDLPGMFHSRLPANTKTGQIRWADILYMRDFCVEDYEQIFDLTLSPHSVLKMASLFELFNFNDCAAEILLKHESEFSQFMDVSSCLDLLVPEIDGKKMNFKDYNNYFTTHPEAFFPKAS